MVQRLSISCISTGFSGLNTVDTGNQGLYIHGTEFGNSAEFWMGLQDDFDLEKERLKIESEVSEILRMKVS